MKRIFATLILVVASGFIFAGGAKTTPVKSGSGDSSKNVIRFTTTDLDGNRVTEKIFADNKITMINIWGTFCGPCINEMPDLGKLSAKYKSKGLEIVGVVCDVYDASQSATAKSIVKKTGANYRHLVTSLDVENTLLKDVQAVPTTIFVDSNGRQIGKTYVGSKSLSQWQSIIDSLLK